MPSASVALTSQFTEVCAIGFGRVAQFIGVCHWLCQCRLWDFQQNSPRPLGEGPGVRASSRPLALWKRVYNVFISPKGLCKIAQG